MQLSIEKDKVRALVDVGIPLNVLIPQKKFKKLALRVGEEVNLVCPVETIEAF